MTAADTTTEAGSLLATLGVAPIAASAAARWQVRSPIDGSADRRIADAIDARQVSAAIGRRRTRLRRLAPGARTAARRTRPPARRRTARAQGDAGRAGHARGRQDHAAKALGEVQEMIDICDFAVGLSRQLHGLTIASERPGHRMMEQWHPLGVVGVISAVQLPGRGLGVECDAGAGLRRPGGLEAEREDAADRAGDAGAVRCGAGAAFATPGVTHPTALCQLVIGGATVGEALVDDPRDRAAVGDRLDADGPRGRTARRRALRPLPARARRQQRDDRRTERRPRAGGARHRVRRLRHGRAALHDDAPRLRPRRASTTNWRPGSNAPGPACASAIRASPARWSAR